MENLDQLQTVILLLIVMLILTALARRLMVPYPILLVIGGLAMCFVPGLPTIQLDPDLVFLVFLPPILWSAAYFTSWRDFRASMRPIVLLAVGLVVATTVAIAMAAHALLPGLGWAGAIALGAIVSPPDAVSATAIAKQLNIPQRIVTILEGESLVNDASALVLYSAAIAAAISGNFGVIATVLHFFVAASLGIFIGLGVSVLTRWALALIEDSFSEIAITLLAPYLAWLITEQVHGSAVLACVAGGLYLRQHFSSLAAPLTRIQARAVWELLVFVLNGLIFILIGLQLGPLSRAVPAGQLGSLIGDGILISVTAISVRLLWVPVAAWVPRRLSSALREQDPMPPKSHLFLIAWTGMRGIVSLAAALALPLTTTAGVKFPFRIEIILITFIVILVTLVVQGLSLPPLIRAFRLPKDTSLEQEEQQARGHAASAALAHLDKLKSEDWPDAEQLERLRVQYERRLQRYSHAELLDSDCTPQSATAYRRLRHELLTAERLTLIRLRNNNVINDEVLHRLEHELDVEALRLGTGELRIAAALPDTNFRDYLSSG